MYWMGCVRAGCTKRRDPLDAAEALRFPTAASQRSFSEAAARRRLQALSDHTI